MSDHRDNLVVDRTRLINQPHAQMLQIDPGYAARSGPLTRAAGVRYCRDLSLPNADSLVQTRVLVVRQLATRLLELDADIAAATAALEQRVRALETPLLQVRGVGAVVAARW